MSFDKKNLIGLFAGIIGLAALKKVSGSQSKIPKGKDGFSREQDLGYFDINEHSKICWRCS